MRARRFDLKASASASFVGGLAKLGCGAAAEGGAGDKAGEGVRARLLVPAVDQNQKSLFDVLLDEAQHHLQVDKCRTGERLAHWNHLGLYLRTHAKHMQS